MSGAPGGAWSPEQTPHDRPVSWENVHDDGSRWDLLSYRSEMMRLDECGPSAETISYLP
jgi:hypothetical protein